MSVKVKRVYDEPAQSDGYRVLVDRLWPRGMKKSKAQIDEWLREIAPSTGLRKWYKHDPSKWEQFKKRYAAELEEHRDQVAKLAGEARKQSVTLLFSARDTAHNNALALKEYVEKLM
jgi:uncharacterized protein YeaO (DUF488 family)